MNGTWHPDLSKLATVVDSSVSYDEMPLLLGYRSKLHGLGVVPSQVGRPEVWSWTTLANPTLANRVWPTEFGDRVWPIRLWPALVF